MLLITILFLGFGFIGLYFGGKYIIIGLENISYHLGISHLMVGLTILAIGTSLPEISVSIMGGIDKVLGTTAIIDDIVIGNKVGSFLIQITLILGLLAVVQQITISKWVLRREGSMMFISVIIFIIVGFDGIITTFEALILIIIYFSYLIFIIRSEKKIKSMKNERDLIEKVELEEVDFQPIRFERKTKSFKVSIGIFFIGLIVLLIAAEITVLAAVELAMEFNVPGNVIGILIIGVGTSIPELSVDLTALRRKSSGIAVGDILGSNICDILLATGSGAIITSFNVSTILLIFDIPMLLGAISLATYLLATEKILKKWEGMLLISFFATYAILKLLFFQN